ncbi:hypothetical protein NVP1042O_05 [Vibrio phage 1.042.O._10N.286.45.B8]|nr:hypothetical protein NVP1042O_05 [Vibrio phage 1.042.O._10N.286.45.B8]
MGVSESNYFLYIADLGDLRKVGVTHLAHGLDTLIISSTTGAFSA